MKPELGEIRLALKQSCSNSPSSIVSASSIAGLINLCYQVYQVRDRDLQVIVYGRRKGKLLILERHLAPCFAKRLDYTMDGGRLGTRWMGMPPRYGQPHMSAKV